MVQGKPCTTYHILQEKSTFPIRDYQLLLQSQHSIGWTMFLQGYPSTQWQSQQLRYIQEMNILKAPDMWLPQFYVKWYTILYNKWKHRNGVLHGEKDNFQRMQLLQRIQGYYKWQTFLPQQDQHCFARSIDEWKHQSLHVMSKWIEINAPYIKNSVHQAKIRQKQQIRDIRLWFRPVKKHTEVACESTASPTSSTANKVPTPPPKKKISEYFRPKKVSITLPVIYKPKSIRNTRARLSSSQQYIKTILKITKRTNKPSVNDTMSGNTGSSSQATYQVQTQTYSPDQPVETNTRDESKRKGLNIANLVKKFERWKNRTTATKNQKHFQKNHFTSHIH